MPPELASRQAVQPWMIVTSVFLASGSGLWYQLGSLGTEPGHISAQWAADSLSRAWHEGVDPQLAFDVAKSRSNEVLADLLQSQLGMFFLGSLFLSTYALGALVTKALFLGQLTIIESTKLAERMLKFVMLKVVFLGAVVNPEPHELGTWLVWFAVLAYFRGFVGLARDRCEALLSSPSASAFQHARCLVLLAGILGQTASWVAQVGAATLAEPTPDRVSDSLLWLFDAVCIFIEAAHALLKYGAHAVERWRVQRAEAAGKPPPPGWEGRAPMLYHVEVAVDILLHVLMLTHYCHLWWLHGFKLQLIDAVLFLDVRYLLAGIWFRARGFALYRRLTHRLQHCLPALPPEQLRGRDCAICMEPLRSARELPCGHAFHLSCLRGWLQQAHAGQFTCPLCRARLDIDLGADADGGKQERGGATRPPRDGDGRHAPWTPAPALSSSSRGGSGAYVGGRVLSSTPSVPVPLYDLLAGRAPALDRDVPAPRAHGPRPAASWVSSRPAASWAAAGGNEDEVSDAHAAPSAGGRSVGGRSAEPLDGPWTLTEQLSQQLASASFHAVSTLYDSRIRSGNDEAVSRASGMDRPAVAGGAGDGEVSSRPEASSVPTACSCAGHRYATRQQTRRCETTGGRAFG